MGYAPDSRIQPREARCEFGDLPRTEPHPIPHRERSSRCRVRVSWTAAPERLVDVAFPMDLNVLPLDLVDLGAEFVEEPFKRVPDERTDIVLGCVEGPVVAVTGLVVKVRQQVGRDDRNHPTGQI